MSDIMGAKTDIALPSIEESRDLCFSLNADALSERIRDWCEQGKEGCEVVYNVVLCRSIRMVLEQNHPYKENLKVKDFETLGNEHDAIMNRTDTDFTGKVKYPFRDAYWRQIHRRVLYWLKYLLTPAIRECAVRQHAFGQSTVNVIRHILSPECPTPNAFFYLVDNLDNVQAPIVEWLTPRLAYLKVGSSSFPEKYRELWRTSRAEYLDSIKDVPLTETPEQVKALSELYARLDAAFETAETERGKSLIANSMVKVMSGLYTLTCDPTFKASQITN